MPSVYYRLVVNIEQHRVVFYFLRDTKEWKEEPYPFEQCTIGTMGYQEWQGPFENSYEPVIVTLICKGCYSPVL
jgi:hypothetical protein